MFRERRPWIGSQCDVALSIERLAARAFETHCTHVLHQEGLDTAIVMGIVGFHRHVGSPITCARRLNLTTMPSNIDSVHVLLLLLMPEYSNLHTPLSGCASTGTVSAMSTWPSGRDYVSVPSSCWRHCRHVLCSKDADHVSTFKIRLQDVVTRSAPKNMD